ncbi:MAG: hypothetical protein GY815_11850, partial [Gammaproteobacteria bacterium]|nr:hypothetical protein [Gammaproteobacteria bacterium]
TRVEGLPARLVEPDTRQDNVWGPWRRMVRAWAADPEVRFEGSTGGVLTALAAYLLASKRVDFILHVKTSTSEPSFGEATLSCTEADVLEAAGRIVPQTERLRIDELARDLPDETNRFQRDGTRKRVEIGKASEPTPEEIW